MANQYKEFAENHLKKKKRELKELELQHQINTADYIARRDILTEDIYEYEIQLEKLQKK